MAITSLTAIALATLALMVNGCAGLYADRSNARSRQNISGFVHLSLVYGRDFRPATPRSIIELGEALNRFTNVRAEIDGHLFLDSEDLHSYPFIYMSVDRAFTATRQEIANLKYYLWNGGFLFLENIQANREYSQGEASLREMMKKALGSKARFRILSNRHRIYHSFFDFDDGPPHSAPNLDPEVVEASILPPQLLGPEPVNVDEVSYFEGIFLNGRLAAVYSNKALGRSWEREFRNEPHLKMGVNLVMFALTQPGAIAQKNAEIYREANP
jgi:hypothetical protein